MPLPSTKSASQPPPAAVAEDPGPAASPGSGRHRLLRASAVVSLMVIGAVLTALFEAVKQWTYPDITIWESHVTTATFFAVMMGASGYLFLRKRDELYAAILEEAHEREGTARKIQQTNSLLLAILESNRDGLVVVDANGRVAAYNGRFLEIWDIAESKLLGRNSELMREAQSRVRQPADFADQVRRLYLDTESEADGIVEFHDGRVLEQHSAPQRVDGVAAGRVWRYRDITANREAQRQIQMLAQTLRSVSECVSVTDLENRIIFVNQSFIETYGFDESELTGQSIALIFSPKTPADAIQRLMQATSAGGWQGEMWTRRKDGTDIQVFLSTSVVRDERGVPIALAGVARDITKDKQTEEALRRGRESDAIVSLAGGIAHEFNNLLQTMMGNTSLAVEELPANSKAHEPLQAVAHATKRAADLTAQLLAYAGRGAFNRRVDIDLNDEIRARVPSFQSLMPPGAALALDLALDDRTIKADRDQIGRILHSLVTNAAEAMAGRTGAIRLSTRVESLPALERRRWVSGDEVAPGLYLCLTVEDQGPGMDTGTVAKIFDPFFSTKFLGRGMGLPAVLGAVRSLAGAVAVDSEPGVGTRVTVAFPIPPATGPR